MSTKAEVALPSGWRYETRMDKPHKVFGQRLRDARVAAGFSQRETADFFQISVQAVSQWESGRSRPEADRVANLAELFNVTGDWLREGIGPRERLAIEAGPARDGLAARYAPFELPNSGLFPSRKHRRLPEKIDDRCIFARHVAVADLMSMEAASDYPDLQIAAGDVLIFDFGPTPRPGDIAVLAASDDSLKLAQVRSVAIDDNDQLVAVVRDLESKRDREAVVLGAREELIGVMVERHRYRKP